MATACLVTVTCDREVWQNEYHSSKLPFWFSIEVPRLHLVFMAMNFERAIDLEGTIYSDGSLVVKTTLRVQSNFAIVGNMVF